MSRLTIEQEISSEEIINNSLDIYKKEVSLTKKGHNYIGLCPLHGERTPSFNVSCNHPYIFKCFGCGKKGNIITFLKERYNTDYKGVLNYIKNNNFVLAPIQQTTAVKKEEKRELIVDWVDGKFTDFHKRYFAEYELDENFLNSRDIYALKILALNKKVQKIPDNQFRFCYYAKDIDSIKVLTLGEGVTKQDKWKSFGIKNDYLWDYWRYKDSLCDNLMVVKSNKDSAVLAKLGYCAISTQNESSISLIKNKDKIEKICKKPIIVFGSDVQGTQESIKANEVLKWRYFNTKKKYLHKYDVNDVAGLIKLYNSKKLINELKEKGL